jgi:hypothetical protein
VPVVAPFAALAPSVDVVALLDVDPCNCARIACNGSELVVPLVDVPLVVLLLVVPLVLVLPWN